MTKEFIVTACITALILGLTTRCAHASTYYVKEPLTTKQAARILVRSPHRHIIVCDPTTNGETSCKEVRIATRLYPITGVTAHHHNINQLPAKRIVLR